MVVHRAWRTARHQAGVAVSSGQGSLARGRTGTCSARAGHSPRCWLAACSVGCSEDDPEPNIDSDPTPSADLDVASASVSTSPTVTPTAMLGPDETVRAWVDAWNSALATGDTAALASLRADGLSRLRRTIVGHRGGLSPQEAASTAVNGPSSVREDLSRSIAERVKVNRGRASRRRNDRRRAAGGRARPLRGRRSGSSVFELEQDGDGWLIRRHRVPVVMRRGLAIVTDRACAVDVRAAAAAAAAATRDHDTRP